MAGFTEAHYRLVALVNSLFAKWIRETASISAEVVSAQWVPREMCLPGNTLFYSQLFVMIEGLCMWLYSSRINRHWIIKLQRNVLSHCWNWPLSDLTDGKKMKKLLCVYKHLLYCCLWVHFIILYRKYSMQSDIYQLLLSALTLFTIADDK